jgi:hypothetical protein
VRPETFGVNQKGSKVAVILPVSSLSATVVSDFSSILSQKFHCRSNGTIKNYKLHSYLKREPTIIMYHH